ncbi:NAD(P)H-dependent flavin oxidoreductase [Streptomyces sp. NPDC015127]|uniref:NAD(P)H-dependent flavin oxidoreductase n=1 Tax=Streptomyces sp. NPDC015127 TaxID=3364939 RepID=UPI0036F869AB
MKAGRLGQLLGIDYPVIQGPFGGGLSSVSLTVAVSEGGGLGSYGAHHLRPGAITKLVAELKASTTRPFAVNLWVPLGREEEPRLNDVELGRHIERIRPYYNALSIDAPSAEDVRSQPCFDEQVDALMAAGPPAVSFVMGIPPHRVIRRAKRLGIAVIGTATTVDEAIALENAGVNVIVASGSDAGGHRGSFLKPVRESLVGTFSLVPQVADAVALPIVAAGGIVDSRGVTAALALGADAVQIGTGFLATRESGASVIHKKALVGSQARTTVLTRLFSGRTARGIPNRFVREMAAHEEDVPPYPIQNALMQPIRRAAAEQGRGDYVNLWAGQAAALTPVGLGAGEYLASLVEARRR